MNDFSAPHSIPQDLLLIQELIGDSLQSSQPTDVRQNEGSSESGTDSIASEDEIEKELMFKTTDNSDPIATAPSSESDESDSGDEPGSDSAPRAADDITRAVAANEDLDYDDDDAPAQASNYMQTKNEVVNVPINIPDIAEVGHDEALEKVGEIMSIVGNVVIVKGLASQVASRGLDKALDADTLLVFDDRKVFGHIYETFGPTSHPFYQVRFNNEFPLDQEKVRVSREVFHDPQRSNYVFLREIKRMKGSDASNVHDEEPAEDELEFSDDEAEAAHRLRMKRKRGGSRASSQQPSSRIAQAHEHSEISAYSGTAFDAYGPYDPDYGISPSRPLPMPYEDPYSDAFNGVSSPTPEIATDTSRSEVASSSYEAKKVSERGGGTTRHHRGQPRNRGRGRGRGGQPSHKMAWSPQSNLTHEGSVEPYSPHDPRLITANSFGRMVPGQSGSAVPYPSMWSGFPQAQSFSFGAQGYQPHSVVQPHINPRFASAFGFNMYPSSYARVPQPSHPFDQSSLTDDWMSHMDSSTASNQNGDPNNNKS